MTRLTLPSHHPRIAPRLIALATLSALLAAGATPGQVSDTNCAAPVDTVSSCSVPPSGCWIANEHDTTFHPWLVQTKSPTFFSNVVEYRAFCSPANKTPGTDGHWFSYAIYLPEGYDLPANQHIRYPVVYWLHESIDRPDQFRDKQGASRDRVQSRHIGRHILPTIYVFPYGGPYNEDPQNEWHWIDEWTDGYNPDHHPGCDPANPNICFRADTAFDELVAHIESNYRVIPETNGRGLEGFSRGGGFALQRAFRQNNGSYSFGSVAANGASADWEEFRFEPNAEELAVDYANAYPSDASRPMELMFLFGDASLDQAAEPMTRFSDHLSEGLLDYANPGVEPISHVIEEVVPRCGEEAGYPPPCPPNDPPPPLKHDWLRMDRLRGDDILAFHQQSFLKLDASYLDDLREHQMSCAEPLDKIDEAPDRSGTNEDYLVGDWNGDGCDSLAVRHEGSFYADNNFDDIIDGSVEVGPEGATYFAINWRDDIDDEIGWAQYSTGVCPGSWEIRLWTDDADGDGHGPEDEPFFCFDAAPPDARFHVGDFDGDWRDDIAFRDGNDISWTPFRDSGYDGRIAGTTRYGGGLSEDQYVHGHWTHEQVVETFAVRRGSEWLLNGNHDGQHDVSLEFGDGASEDQYLAGDWDGDGRTDLAVRRCHQVFVDLDFDGFPDHWYYFGWGTGGCHCNDTCP